MIGTGILIFAIGCAVFMYACLVVASRSDRASEEYMRKAAYNNEEKIILEENLYVEN